LSHSAVDFDLRRANCPRVQPRLDRHRHELVKQRAWSKNTYLFNFFKIVPNAYCFARPTD
jgi:hypothetical protein